MPPRRSAFTLVELMVVVGLIGSLIALLMPALSRARESARAVRCASNLHQISVAMVAYAAQNHGRYPPNTSSPLQAWYDDERLGAYLPATRPPVPAGKPGGGVYICPDDWCASVFLSYAMNVWASSKIDAAVLAAQSPASARPWSALVSHADQMILITEAYSGTGSNAGWYAPATVGTAYATTGAPAYAAAPTSAGQRFGGAGGVLYTAGLFKKVTSELCFARHRTTDTGLAYTAARGRLNIAYADGHVAARTDRDLVRPDGTSTGDSCWSPADLAH